MFYINLNCSKTNRRNSRTHVASCSLTNQRLTWLFAIGCETIRLKHATLLAKLPINADNTSRGVAWMKWKDAVFLQRSTNSDETFWEDYFDEILPNQIETLGQEMINPSTPRNGVLCNNTMFLTARLELWLVGMRRQVEGSQVWNVQKVTVSAAHKLC